MHPHFQEVISELDPKFETLTSMAPLKIKELPNGLKVSGIYLFSEGRKNLYVGRTKDIKARLGRHSLPGATEKMAAFAFQLAREATGKTKPTYAAKDSRADLMSQPKFKKAFDDAKARIREMDVRYVEEPDPARQCLLEVYVAVALETPYNSFETH